MQTLSDIENTIANLPPDQLAEFREWFEAFDAGSAAFPMTKAIEDELDRRMDALEAGQLPAGRSWEEVKSRLQSQ